MKTTSSLFLILMSFSGFAQNLVPNGDFESYGDCSEGASFSILDDWFWPEGGGSSDFFHSCSNEPFPNTGVPSNIFGFQEPHSGEGYAGFGTYVDGMELIEYLRVELINPLEANQEYCVSFFLSWADSSSYTSKFLHVLFKEENDWIYDGQDDNYADLAQVVFDDVNVVDGDGWKFFSKSFIASGNERFMTIGNFLSNQDMQLEFIGYEQIPYYAYYFIDDVSLQLCSTESVEIENFENLQLSYESFTRRFKWNIQTIDRITIRTVVGKLIFDRSIESGTTSIEIPELNTGVFIVSVFQDNRSKSIKIKIE